MSASRSNKLAALPDPPAPPPKPPPTPALAPPKASYLAYARRREEALKNPKPKAPSILQQLSNGLMRMSSAVLGLPLEHDVLAAAMLDEDDSVPTPEEALAHAESFHESDMADLPGGGGAGRGLDAFRAVANATRFVTRLAGATSARNTVFPPECEVGQLLAEHAAAVAEMATRLEAHSLYDATVHDGLWRLRFLLSAKCDVAKASAAATACLEWRRDNKIDEITAKLKSTPWAEWPGFAQVTTYTPLHITHPDARKGTVVFQRLAENDFDALLGSEKAPALDDETWIQYQLYMKEWLYVRRDATSRRTGSLAKNIAVVDMAGFSRKHLGNKRFKKLMTSPAIKTADEMYPQALGTIVIVGLPGALAWLFNTVVKPLAPPKVQEKIRVVSAGSETKEYAKVGVDLAHVPSALGGTMQGWPPGPDARHLPPS